MKRRFYVYILAKARNSTFYVGVTSDLAKRVWEHKQGLADGFTKKYGIKTLVYYEVFNDSENAFKREKRLKRWPRTWKMEAIESLNPDWRDLYDAICTKRFADETHRHPRQGAKRRERGSGFIIQ